MRSVIPAYIVVYYSITNSFHFSFQLSFQLRADFRLDHGLSYLYLLARMIHIYIYICGKYTGLPSRVAISRFLYAQVILQNNDVKKNFRYIFTLDKIYTHDYTCVRRYLPFDYFRFASWLLQLQFRTVYWLERRYHSFTQYV